MQAPNILFIFPDQWRGDCIGALGHPDIETPHLDELVNRGVSFTSAYTNCPVCIPARASLVTGKTTATLGRFGYRDQVPWEFDNTLMHCLRDNGYETLCSGKTHFYPQMAKLGFEKIKMYHSLAIDEDFHSDYHHWLEEKGNGLYRDTAVEVSSNTWVAYPWQHPEPLHPNSWTVTAAIEMLKERDQNRPFFLQLGFHRPHPPFDPPLAFYERYRNKTLSSVPRGDWCEKFNQPIKGPTEGSGFVPDDQLDATRKAYYAQCTHLDYQIGRMIHYLRMNNLLNNTYIVFSSDHGEMLGDHYMFKKSVGFEGSAHIPMIAVPPSAWKSHPSSGLKVEAPVTLYDIMPTLLDVAGVEIPPEVEGQSFNRWVEGELPPWRDFMHGEHVAQGHRNCQYVTDGKEKYIWEPLTNREFFFDLKEDPQEYHNLATHSDKQERVRLWRNRLIKILENRPQDGMVEDGKLVPMKSPPNTRPELIP